MSWRQNNYSNQPFNPHGGRNAFRGSDANDDDASGADRAASFRAMRSFTQSIECDDLPTAPELPPELDIDQIEGLKNSDTNDTIIEVIKPKKTDVDPQLGETQKYKMTVPGPGHSEQEQELHKSLIRAEDEDLDLEIEHAMSENTTDAKAPPSAFSRNIGNDTQSSKEQDIRREYNNVAVQRRRPTTPTSQCTIESFAFVGGQDPADVKPDEKIKVSIPSSRRRRSDMSYSDFCDNMSQQMPSQSKGKASGRTTPINNYDGDILEEDPAYKSKAPPHPVVHRRASMDWENFEEQKDRLQMENAVASSSKSNQSSSPEEDDQPTFSEEMQEERKKLRKKIHKAAVEDTSNKIEKNPEEAVEQSNSETTSEEISQEGVTTAQEVDTATHELDTAEHQVQAAVSEAEIAEPEKEAAAVPETEAALAPESDVAAAQEGEASENQTYDPNAYPGYIWNYETQQWETDPNYVPTDSNYDYSQNQADQQYYENGQQSTEYNQYYAGYDQNNYDQSTTQYDYTTAAFHAGYDQATDSYGNTYNSNYDQNYDYSNYNQTGYDQTNYSSTTAGYDDQASYNQQTYPGYDSSYTGYDQNASNQQYDHNQSGNDQTSYNQAAETQDYNSSYQENGDNTDDYGTSTQYPDASQYNETAQYNKSTEHQNSTQPQDSTQYADTSNYQESNQNHYDYNSQYDYNQTSYNDPSGYKYSQDDQQAYSSDHQNYNNTEYSYSSSQNVPDRPEPPPFDVPDFVAPSWNEQQNNVEKPAEEITEKKEPPRPPPPSRPAPPKSTHVSDVSSTAEEESQQVQAAPPRPPPASKGPPQRPQAPHPANIPEKEEDAWAVFKKMTEKVSSVVKNTEEQLKTLSETTAANEIKDESYLADVGGEQGYVHNGTQREIQKRLEEQKNAKILKKKLKQQGKKVASPTFDPDEEDSMDRAAQELAAKLAAKMNLEMETEKTAPVIPPPPKEKKAEELERSDSVSAIPSHKKSSLKEAQQDSGGSLELPSHLITQQRDSIAPKGDLDPSDPVLSHPAWADFDATACLPPSESGFFSNKEPVVQQSDTQIDPFAPPDRSLIDDTYDPFAVAPVEDIVAAAKAKAVEVQQQCQGKDDVDFYAPGRQSPPLSSPTPEGGSPVSHRPEGFEDNFKCAAGDDGTPTPLYDEDDSQPLEDFIPKFAGEGWELMVRHPIKKKSFMVERCWKPCYVKLQDHVLVLYNSKTDSKPIQELHLQATYSLSDTTLQAYDIYGKIHTVKLQYVQYREKVGIRPGQISRLVDGHITKYGLPLEHSAQCNVLLKFGSLNAPELRSFVNTIEDILFRCSAKRDTKPLYKQDEVQVHCYDEYSAYVDKDGIVSDQKARVRLFCLAFVTGSPFLEIGLNDRRRQGKEIVRRKDILPMYTERWIRFENLEFHNTVDEDAFEKEQVIRLSPPDGCFFEIMRFRVRPPRNREKFLNIKTIMKIAGSKVEIRMEVMAAAEVERSKGGKSTRRQIPCEDVAIKFPIPEAWIYIFREERHWGVGSVHSKKLKPGKVQNLKDRLLGAVQSNEPNLIEVAIGEAKYEHVFRSLVWRIPRLPEKHHAAYKSHSLKCRFELSSFDLMPETFLPRCEVDFTMPLATVSNTVVRSVSVEQHEDSDRVEKFVRYVAKCQYKVEIDYVQCADLEVDTLDPTVNPEQAMSSVPELHQPAFEPTEVAEMHDGYRIDLPEQPERTDANDSSSDDDDDDKSHKMPIIQIDMKNYGY